MSVFERVAFKQVQFIYREYAAIAGPQYLGHDRSESSTPSMTLCIRD